MSSVISQLQAIIGNLKKNKDKTFKTTFRMADFAEFAFKIASRDEEIKELEEMFSSLSRQQKDFATRDNIVYILLKEIVGRKYNQNRPFSTTDLFDTFKKEAEAHGLEKSFNGVYTNPKAVTSQLMNLRDNISNEIIINRKKGHGNAYYYSFSLVDKTKPISQSQEIEMLMDREAKKQINAYERYQNIKGGKNE